MALSKQSILKHAGMFTVTPVHVPELADETGDDVVLVRGMTLREFEINQTRSDDGLASASVISRCVLDANGGRVFEDANVNAIAELPLAAANTIIQAVMKASGLVGDDGKPKTVDETIADAEGNSGPTPDGSGSSD